MDLNFTASDLCCIAQEETRSILSLIRPPTRHASLKGFCSKDLQPFVLALLILLLLSGYSRESGSEGCSMFAFSSPSDSHAQLLAQGRDRC